MATCTKQQIMEAGIRGVILDSTLPWFGYGTEAAWIHDKPWVAVCISKSGGQLGVRCATEARANEVVKLSSDLSYVVNMQGVRSFKNGSWPTEPFKLV